MDTIVTEGAVTEGHEMIAPIENEGTSRHQIDRPTVEIGISVRSVMRATRQNEVGLEFDPIDPENPRTFSNRKKLLIAFAVTFPGFVS